MPEMNSPSSTKPTPARERDLLEFLSRVVKQEIVVPVVGDEKVGPPVEIVVRHAHAHGLPDVRANAPLRRHILEGSIAPVQK